MPGADLVDDGAEDAEDPAREDSVRETSLSLTRRLRDPFIEHCVEANRAAIERDALLCGIDARTFERQVRLHLPSTGFTVAAQGDPAAAYGAVRSTALVRAATIAQETRRAEQAAHASLLTARPYRVRRSLALSAEDGSTLPLRFGPVRPSVGFGYQSRLHYLKSPRADTRLHYGLFLPGARAPLTYVALSACDRPYIADTLIAADLGVRREECAVITRMYGLPGMPANLMSLTLSQVVAALRARGGTQVVLTSYNPLLGFDGAAFRAASFRPFAIAPVSYKYTARGEFTSRRIGGGVRTSFRSPPNVLLARGVGRSVQRKIIESRTVVGISARDYQERVTVTRTLPDIDHGVWLKQLDHYRALLEGAWSARTVHPAYLGGDFSPNSSRGQCGVSSVWLARELRHEHGVDARYCYGDLFFSDPAHAPVRHHCWLEVGAPGDSARVVIDITCDQAETIHERVLCGRHDRLAEQGLDYRAHSRLGVDELPNDRVWHRFEALSDNIHDRGGR